MNNGASATVVIKRPFIPDELPHQTTDPRSTAPLDQLVAWVSLYLDADQTMKDSIAECWPITLRKLSQSECKWPKVIGPLSATIATLLDAS